MHFVKESTDLWILCIKKKKYFYFMYNLCVFFVSKVRKNRDTLLHNWSVLILE